MANLNENRKLMIKQIKSLRNLNESADISSKVAESIVLALDKYAKTVNDYKYKLPTESRHMPKLVKIILDLAKVDTQATSPSEGIKLLAINIIKHLDHYAKQKIDPDVFGLPIDNNPSMKKMISIVVKLIK